jgi:Na+/H+-dicarboxylate symporter
MKLAPYGVAALLFKVVGTTGLSVLLALGFYSLVVLAGLLLHIIITYSTVIRFGARLPVFPFLKAIRPALLLAFSTSSSSATLPVTKQCTEDGLNVSPAVSSFVLPLGATINMDGTALYQAVAAVFIAQTLGIALDLQAQLTIVFMALLASIGTAAVPSAGVVMLVIILEAIGVPIAGIALILGVDRFLDMCRTAANVTGDATVAAVVAASENQLFPTATNGLAEAEDLPGGPGHP